MKPETGRLIEIYKPIVEDLDRVGSRLLEIVSEALEPFPREIGAFRSMGKRLRPAISLLAFRSEAAGRKSSPENNGHVPQSVIEQASAVELMHIATLIHDDVVDGAYQRRGHQTLHRLFTDKTAVLVGDYLYATAIDIFNRHSSRHIVDVVTRTTVGMAHGELMQVLLPAETRSAREVYQEIISKKTADFFAAAAMVGYEASFAGEPATPDRSARRELFRLFGWNFGMAFQMIDDLLDVTASEDNVGKPVFQDILDGKVTLPAILLLESGAESAEILKHILSERNLSPAAKTQLAEDLARQDIVSRAIGEASAYLDGARSTLFALFGQTPPSASPQASLIALCDYILLQRGLPSAVVSQ